MEESLISQSMDLLRREWIGPTIERGLNDGLAWLFKKPADLVDQHKSACSRFEDDDSNLRVHVPKSGVVQIAKV